MRLNNLRARRRAIRSGHEQRGTVTVFVAIWLLVIFGLSAVGIDGGYWYLQRRQQQNAADMAAIAGAVQVATDVQAGYLNSNGTPIGSPTSSNSSSSSNPSCPSAVGSFYQVKPSAQLVSCANGFVNTEGDTTVTVNWPPTSGTHKTDTAVEVIVQRPAPLLLSAFVRAFSGMTQRTIGARAVAAYTTSSFRACVVSLHSTLTITGSSSVNAPNCVFMSNYANWGTNQISSSIYVSGNTGTNNPPGTRSIEGFATMGSCTGCSTASSSSPLSLSGASYTPDPFNDPTGSGVVLSDISNAFETTTNPTDKATLTSKQAPDYGGQTLSPGLYSGITANGGTVTFSGGLYVIGTGGLNVVSNGGLVCSTTCTFIIVNGGTVQITATSNLDLSAPTYSSTDPSATTSWLNNLTTATKADGTLIYPELQSFDAQTLAQDLGGVLMYGDNQQQQQQNGNYVGNGGSMIAGTDGSKLSGALYFPNSNLQLSGNSTINGTANSSCLEAIAGSVTFIGNNTTSMITSGCSNLGLPKTYVHYVELVE